MQVSMEIVRDGGGGIHGKYARATSALGKGTVLLREEPLVKIMHTEPLWEVSVLLALHTGLHCTRIRIVHEHAL